ncbi:hypothetical protein DUNSADRAFT_2966 [Dunaliella salina]|uniref:Encoded protein n=1 Tax=Dunaliella salina TaxID=3046 RepID=A0ABQ7GUS9_DUNSA|nr:hypothetical protein DUNSADRAFT_2966 [Dunaliella salina]|eukprot:KAF5838356.1 hypothetical protein DUNSADRAFT_2966 [Dunaliella salina]
MDQLLNELNISQSQNELELIIRYNGKEVVNGACLPPSKVSQPPSVEIRPSSSSDDNGLYCLALIDADSQPRSSYYMYPTVADPTREWYLFVLWKQQGPLTEPEDSLKCDRANWKHEHFARDHNLNPGPVALKYFVSSPEAMPRSSTQRQHPEAIS